VSNERQPYEPNGRAALKTLLHYVAGAIFCIGLGSVAFILRVPLRGRGNEFGTMEQVLAVVVIGIGLVYAFLAVRDHS